MLPTQAHRRNAGILAAGLYVLAYAASLWGLSRFPGFSLVEPLFVLAILAIADGRARPSREARLHS